MKVYLVGGAVRDELLGIVPQDRDYVVTGSTPEEMLSLGYKEVGANFPVFLHPKTGEEYALARTEESTGSKYKDFNCYFGKDVTIEQDLHRRDLSINSIAKDLETEEYIDPYGGMQDIKDKLLRHTSEAFQEDPVRVLRLARFLSQLGDGWHICTSTLFLASDMENRGVLEGLVPERVWGEMLKSLKTSRPSNFISLLSPTSLFPEISALYNCPQREDHHPEGSVGVHTEMVMDYAASQGYDADVVFACLVHDLGKPGCWEEYENAHGHELAGLLIIERFCTKWKVPNKYRELALLVCEYHTKIHACLGRGTNKGMRPKSIMKLFEGTSALRKPSRFLGILQACIADARGRGGDFPNREYPQSLYLWECLMAAKRVDTSVISDKMLLENKKGTQIGEAIRVVRISAIRGVYNDYKNR